VTLKTAGVRLAKSRGGVLARTIQLVHEGITIAMPDARLSMTSESFDALKVTVDASRSRRAAWCDYERNVRWVEAVRANARRKFDRASSSALVG
jgi:hypothetical protein